MCLLYTCSTVQRVFQGVGHAGLQYGWQLSYLPPVSYRRPAHSDQPPLDPGKDEACPADCRRWPMAPQGCRRSLLQMASASWAGRVFSGSSCTGHLCSQFSPVSSKKMVLAVLPAFSRRYTMASSTLMPGRWADCRRSLVELTSGPGWTRTNLSRFDPL